MPTLKQAYVSIRTNKNNRFCSSTRLGHNSSSTSLASDVVKMLLLQLGNMTS